MTALEQNESVKYKSLQKQNKTALYMKKMPRDRQLNQDMKNDHHSAWGEWEWVWCSDGGQPT